MRVKKPIYALIMAVLSITGDVWAQHPIQNVSQFQEKVISREEADSGDSGRSGDIEWGDSQESPGEDGAAEDWSDPESYKTY
jgi:hypothetical protein